MGATKRKQIGEKERKPDRRGREGRKRGIFLVFRRSKLNDLSSKVDPRIASYTWGTKILDFCQTPRGREFSYLDYFYPKSHLMTYVFFGAITGCVI